MGERLANFDFAIEELGLETPVTIDDVSTALKSVSQTVFPHRALERQKQWMLREMKKPFELSSRRYFCAVARVNQDLQRFPGADETSKFSDSEVLNLLEWSLPTKWCCKFDYDGYIPSEHDKARLLKECEAIERNQQQDPKKDKTSNNRNKKDRNGMPVHETSKAEHQKGAGKTRPECFCDECGKNYTHNTAQCWKLQKKEWQFY